MRREFKAKDSENQKKESVVTKKNENLSIPPKIIQEHPRICLIDVAEDIAANLMGKGYNCYSGTLGSVIEVNNTSSKHMKQCLLHYNFPPNLQEYDITVVDLQQPIVIPYVEKDHTQTHVRGYKQGALLSLFPETIFDPRALSSAILESNLRSFMSKPSILIIFAAAYETIQYHPIEITARGIERHDLVKRSLYEFYSHLPHFQNITGKDTKVVLKSGTELTDLLERHNKNASYDITFSHPTYIEQSELVKDKNFLPLMEARPDEIVSFAHFNEDNITLLFPRIQQKGVFLIDLLEKVLPGILPRLFPFNTQLVWLANSDYQLPNESELLEQKVKLETRYEIERKEIDSQIKANHQKYSFLHDLLSQSGPELVKTVEKYLRWLGFDSVINVDGTNPTLQEEDLRVENDRGLLVIEVKGIGGTSTDSDCSQISKIKYRRSRERGKFDVFALYMVNHQRFLPPTARTDPPFNKTQITDAENDERGLVTTYDLFKLYFNITKGYVTKEDGRASLYQTGLVRFPPSGAIAISGPYEIHHDGYVVIFRDDSIEVRVGDSVVLDDSGRYRGAKIIEIQVNSTSVEYANKGEIGMKLSECVKKDTIIWLIREIKSAIHRVHPK